MDSLLIDRPRALLLVLRGTCRPWVADPALIKSTCALPWQQSAPSPHPPPRLIIFCYFVLPQQGEGHAWCRVSLTWTLGSRRLATPKDTGAPHWPLHPTPCLTAPLWAVSCLPSMPAVCRQERDNALCMASEPLCPRGVRMHPKAFQGPSIWGPWGGLAGLPDVGAALYSSSLTTKGDHCNGKTEGLKKNV